MNKKCLMMQIVSEIILGLYKANMKIGYISTKSIHTKKMGRVLRRKRA
jgi:hypothetical protein